MRKTYKLVTQDNSPRRVYEKEKIIPLQLRCCLFASKQRLLFENPALFEGVNIVRMGVNIVRIHKRPRVGKDVPLKHRQTASVD